MNPTMAAPLRKVMLDFPTHGFTMSDEGRELRLRELLEFNEQERWNKMHTPHSDDCWLEPGHGRCREAFLLAEIGRLKQRKRVRRTRPPVSVSYRSPEP